MHWHRCHKPKDSFLSTSPFRPATQIVLPAGPTKPDRNEDEAEHNKAKRYCIELLILHLISKRDAYHSIINIWSHLNDFFDSPVSK